MNGQGLLITLGLGISGIIVLIQVLQMSAIADFVARWREWSHRQDVAVAAIAAKMEDLMAGASTLEDNLALDEIQAQVESLTRKLEGLAGKPPVAGMSAVVQKPAPSITSSLPKPLI